MKRILCSWLALAIAAPLLAAPIVYQGQLSNAVPSVGNIPLNADGLGYDNPEDWDWWYLYAEAGNVATVEINRLVSTIDPASSAHRVIAGLPTDTNPMVTIFESPAGTTLLAFGDDEDPPAVTGPFGDPHYSFPATTTGFYTIAVANYAGGTPGAPGDYEIIVTGITPEPASFALLGLGALALIRRR
jgi:hypothetical protein